MSSPEWFAAHMNKMERLEIYNIGQPLRSVYKVAPTNRWRKKNIERLKNWGLIEETRNPIKVYQLTPLGAEVYPLIIIDAILIIQDFKNRRTRIGYK